VEGLEPPRLAAPEPKSGASANSATPALHNDYYFVIFKKIAEFKATHSQLSCWNNAPALKWQAANNRRLAHNVQAA
jgi:hypothetical protein